MAITSYKFIFSAEWNISLLCFLTLQNFLDMLDTHHAFVRKLVLMVEIPLEFSEFISLRKWNSSALPAQTAMNLGTHTRKLSKTRRIFTRWHLIFCFSKYYVSDLFLSRKHRHGRLRSVQNDSHVNVMLRWGLDTMIVICILKYNN